MGAIDTMMPDIVRADTSWRSSERQGIVRLLLRAIQFLAIRAEKRRSRAILRTLTDDELRDIGITRAEAGHEASKSFFWD